MPSVQNPPNPCSPLGWCCAFLLVCAASATAAPVSRSSLSADLLAWETWLFATHPAPQHSMDMDHVRAQFAQLRNTARDAPSPREAWLQLARMNVEFHDAHVGLRLPDDAYAEALQRGAAAFCAEVSVQSGTLFLEDSGYREVVHINEQPATRIVERLVPLMRGETPALRERVLALRFTLAIWTVLGDQAEYTLSLRQDAGRLSRRTLPSSPCGVEDAPREPFALAVDGDIAVLTVDTFDRHREAAFAAFLADAFATIHAAGVTHLAIDLRQNGGGAHDVSDRLMGYLTSERFAATSRVVARITPENQARVPGSTVGDVLDLPFAQWVTPPAELAHRFTGEVTIAIGPQTYSQAIVFATTARDFGIATLVGQPTGGFANQSGQVVRFTLPNTGFDVQAPLYVFTRPSGEAGAYALRPDLPLAPDAELVAALRAMRRR